MIVTMADHLQDKCNIKYSIFTTIGMINATLNIESSLKIFQTTNTNILILHCMFYQMFTVKSSCYHDNDIDSECTSYLTMNVTFYSKKTVTIKLSFKTSLRKILQNYK